MRSKSLAMQQIDVPTHTDIGVLDDDPVRRARFAILAAKSAFQFKSERWLRLFGTAVNAIEECPTDLQPKLFRQLQSLQHIQVRRPKSYSKT
jgi:hypothetical protein